MSELTEGFETDMTDSFFNLDEFGEEVVYTPVSGEPSVIIPAVYDEPALSEGIGASIEAISHQPHIMCKCSDLPTGSPAKGDQVEVSETILHEAGYFKVVDTVHEKFGHVDLILRAIKDV